MTSFTKTNYNSFTSTSIPSIYTYAKDCCTSYDKDLLKLRPENKSNDLHYYLKNCRHINKTKINSFHRTCLQEKIKHFHRSRHPTIFVTNSNIIERERLKSLPDSFDFSHKHSSVPRTITSESSWSSNYFETNYNFLNQRTLGTFVNNVRTFQRKRILTLCQRESLRQYKEKLRKRDESVQVMKYSLRKNNVLLEHFVKNLGQYVKNLDIVVEKEKMYCVTLIQQQQELDIENNKLRQKIAKLENKLALYKEYKLFLIKVKFKVKDPSELPLNERIKYGLVSNLELLALAHSKEPLRTQQTNVKRGSLRLATRRSIQRNSFLRLATRRQSKAATSYNNQGSDINKENKSNDLIPTNIPIFDSVDEFIERWHIIENNPFTLFDKFNNNFDSLFYLKRNQKEENDIYNERKYHRKTYKVSLMEDVDKLKQEHGFLNKKLSTLKVQLMKSDVNPRLTKKLTMMLLAYPIDIENIVNENKVYSFLNANTDVVLVNGFKVNKLTYMLTILEKILLRLFFEIESFKEKSIANQMLYREWNYAICKENRERKNRLNKLIQKQNREAINEKVLNKINKVNYKAKRTVSFTPVFLISKIKKKVKERVTPEENNDYETLLTY